MQFIVTEECESHRVNPNYKTLLLVWTGEENNIRPLGFTGNWQPTDLELKELVMRLAEISPTFAVWLQRFAFNLDVKLPNPKPKRIITAKTELSELLF